jgi:hypothetical protein
VTSPGIVGADKSELRGFSRPDLRGNVSSDSIQNRFSLLGDFVEIMDDLLDERAKRRQQTGIR